MFVGSSASASFYCRACGNQIVENTSDNETVLGSSRKLGGAAEHLIDGSEKRAVGWSLNFRVCMILKSAVKRRGHKHVMSLHLSSYIIHTRLQMLEHWIHLILSQSNTGYSFEHVLCGNDVCQSRISQSTVDKIPDITSPICLQPVFL